MYVWPLLFVDFIWFDEIFSFVKVFDLKCFIGGSDYFSFVKTIKDLSPSCFKAFVKVIKFKVLATKVVKVIKASLNCFKPFKEHSSVT